LHAFFNYWKLEVVYSQNPNSCEEVSAFFGRSGEMFPAEEKLSRRSITVQIDNELRWEEENSEFFH
jgi:hypothetical protein